MYALRCTDLNFWEETPGQPDCGVQEVVSTELTKDGNGLQQELLWRHETHRANLETYRETRHVRCHYDASNQAFVWTWTSHREALRDHRLTMSNWSMPNTKGDRINYHGLGIRLPRSWAFPIETMRGCTVAGQAMDWREAHGAAAEEVTLWGTFDGHWDPPAGSVTFRQEHGYAHFVLMDGFAYLSAGPSNAAELDVRAGETFDEQFTIEVADRISL